MPGMCRGPAAKTRDDEDFPSPQHYFQRSVTLPAMMEDEGKCFFLQKFDEERERELHTYIISDRFHPGWMGNLLGMKNYPQKYCGMISLAAVK